MRNDDAAVEVNVEAPSICAARISSLSMPRSPARNIAMTKPDDCQMAAMTTV